MVKASYSSIAASACDGFNSVVDAEVIKQKIGTVPGLATDKITLTGKTFGGSQIVGDGGIDPIQR